MNSLQKISIEHSILERKSIIDNYYTTRVLDRKDAISKIMELRAENFVVLETELVGMAASGSSIPLERATDEQLVNQLSMQMDILIAELEEG